MIHWELCKRFKFSHTNKQYMHKPESDLENETHRLLRDFEIQRDHLISARRPNLVIVIKRKITYRIADFAVPAGHRVKLKENEKRDMYLDLASELKKNYGTWKWR